tara:strand:- start:77 stop:415 length:339 start_codon:yes stop_codon:yes gene_type:complete
MINTFKAIKLYFKLFFQIIFGYLSKIIYIGVNNEEKKLEIYTNTIKEHIIKEGRTGKWLASRIGVHESELSRWIKGERTPNDERLKKLCKLLCTSREKLYPNGKLTRKFKIQ